MTGLHMLQNGSDIRGVVVATDEFRATLTPNETAQIAIGVVSWMKNIKGISENLVVAIGQDSRISGDDLKEGLVSSLLSQGVNVIDTGLSTTPAMFMATQFAEIGADVGIMITASHLPFYYNGLKFFTKDGGAENTDIKYILEHTTDTSAEILVPGTLYKKDVVSLYAKDMVEKIRAKTGSQTPLADFHIVLDAGNGAGGFFAEKVLEPLGAYTKGSQFLEPDGYFPNHIPNPDNKEAMESIQSAVLDEKADLGVIFDTDVDRAAVVDKTGQVINRNNLIAVLSSIVLEESPGATIVTNSPTSSHLKDFIESLGGHQVRYLCGYRNVINKAVELNAEGVDVPLAIETSGHAAFKENYFLDDGAYVIAKLLMLLPSLKASEQEIGDLIKQLKQPAEATEVRFRIESDDDRNLGESVIAALHDTVASNPDWQLDSDNEEGIRVSVSGAYGTGWFLLRMSLHEPLLVLQVENDVHGKNREVFSDLAPFFNHFTFLNTEALKLELEK